VYLRKKPNPIVRYFSKLLLNFEWKDKWLNYQQQTLW
jgi:hypothetical protein